MRTESWLRDKGFPFISYRINEISVCHVCGNDVSSPLVRVEYEQELIFTEVLRHPQGLNFCKAVSQHLAYTRLS